MEALLEVHTKNADLVQKAFRGDASFGASLDKVSLKPGTRKSAYQISRIGLPRVHQPKQGDWQRFLQIARIGGQAR